MIELVVAMHHQVYTAVSIIPNSIHGSEEAGSFDSRSSLRFSSLQGWMREWLGPRIPVVLPCSGLRILIMMRIVRLGLFFRMRHIPDENTSVRAH